jgi:glycosyltransferase involved in cell wall biosynthesis
MRLYDSISANRVDAYIANSKTVAARINKTYRRRAQVVYPPVDTDSFALHREKEDFYVTMSRLVPYKRVDLIVEAFAQMPDKELIVIGDGPEFKRIKAMATPNVSMIGYQPDEAVLYYLQRARGFVYAAEEDFGIVNVEAQACGTPVIAYGKGGATETIIPGETGILFDKQSTDALRRAIHSFEEQRFDMDPEHIRGNAERFSQARFHQEFSQVVKEEYQIFHRPSYSPVWG